MKHRSLGAVAALVCALCIQIAEPHAKLKVGDQPPERFGKTQDGERVRLGDYRGRIVIIRARMAADPAPTPARYGFSAEPPRASGKPPSPLTPPLST